MLWTFTWQTGKQPPKRQSKSIFLTKISRQHLSDRFLFTNTHKNYLKQFWKLTHGSLQLWFFKNCCCFWHWFKWGTEEEKWFLRGKSWKVARMLFRFWTKVSSLVLILIEMTLELLGFKQSTLGETQIVCLADGGPASCQGVATEVSTPVRWSPRGRPTQREGKSWNSPWSPSLWARQTTHGGRQKTGTSI